MTTGRTNLDFGQGFYVTREIGQAMDWLDRRFNAQGSILEFTVSEKEFYEFRGEYFPSANDEWVKFVTDNRIGAVTHNYDYVEGPVLKNPQDVRTDKPLIGFGNQISIHSPAMALWLMKGFTKNNIISGTSVD